VARSCRSLLKLIRFRFNPRNAPPRWSEAESGILFALHLVVRRAYTLLLTLLPFAAWAESGRSNTDAEFFLDYREGFVWITVSASKSPSPLNFILDSGAAVSVINGDTAERLGLRDGQMVSVKGVGAMTTGRWPQTLKASIGSVTLPRRYLVVDLCNLQASCSCRIDGLLGADFLEGRVVQLDFSAKRLRLLRSSSTVKGEVVELKKKRDVWQVPLRVNGAATEWFRLDTGCATGLQWVNGGHGRELYPRNVSVALTALALPATKTTVEVGRAVVRLLPTSIHQSEIFPGEAGLAGMGFLSRFAVVTLDGKADRLILDGAITN
jgi:hypothetical protein